MYVLSRYALSVSIRRYIFEICVRRQWEALWRAVRVSGGGERGVKKGKGEKEGK